MGEAGNDLPLRGVHGQVQYKPMGSEVVSARILRILVLIFFIFLQIPGTDSAV